MDPLYRRRFIYILEEPRDNDYIDANVIRQFVGGDTFYSAPPNAESEEDYEENND